MGRKSKDVTPRENAPRARDQKKRADSLPKILALAARSGSLQTQRIRCGKPNCKCARGELHEGYHYLYLPPSAGLSKVYVRRRDVPVVRAVIESRKRRDAAFCNELAQARTFLRRMMLDAVGVRI
jgi:hypothetical protein